MGLNPFDTVSSYSAMLNKIAVFTFFVALGVLAVFVWQVPAAASILPGLNFKIPDTEIEVRGSVFIGALIVAFIFRIFKIHDRISDLFGIRQRFDIFSILVPMASASGVSLSLAQQEKLPTKRHQLMRGVFYRYASSSESKSVIDPHSVTMALDQWSWYWICVEGICVTALGSVAFAFWSQYKTAFYLLVIDLLVIWLLQGLKELSRRYARDEIRQILEIQQDSKRYGTSSMHYRVLGHVICTERTAKPKKQTSAYLRDWIRSHDQVKEAVDYGCGRLRYAFDLMHVSRNLTLVDSEHQLSRMQLIEGHETTLRDFVRKNMPRARVMTIEEFETDRHSYDFCLCANVLPIIPNSRVRAQVIRRLSVKTRPEGRCLFVTQYRNSYFDSLPGIEGSNRYLDGWAVVRGNSSSSYYGILAPMKVRRLAERNGFDVDSSWINGQSTYVLCAPPKKASTMRSKIG
jgi:hypothetical protein